MKKLLLLTACSLTLFGTSQNIVNISSTQYETLKLNGQLDATKNYVLTDVAYTGSAIHYNDALRSPSTICSCLVPLDTSFSVVPFTSGTAPDFRNDDGSATIAIPFSFNFYGTNYSSVYVNNNGNVSFVNSYITFISAPFPSNAYKMITPFWADVDTRFAGSGIVYYKVTPTHIIIKWEHVHAFGNSNSLFNTFQIVLTDGTDPILPAGKNVGFCYDDMQWTSASGVGGSPATVGVNKGDSVNYFQVGRFSPSGVAFDGPYGNNDGIDWLDNQGVYFNVSSSGNIPPVIINNSICDTMDVFTGDTTHSMIVDEVQFTIGVSTPEVNQTVNATITSPDATNLSYTIGTNTPTYKEYLCTFSVRNLATGLHYVTITATDDGTPAAQTTQTVVIRSHYDATLAGINELSTTDAVSLYPNPTEGMFTISSTKYKVASIKVTDVLGKIVNCQQSTGTTTIDLSNYAKGVYFATITGNDGQSKTIKVVRK